MVITGEEDYRTPISESEQYFQALKLLNLKKARILPDDATFLANSSISLRRLGQNRFQNGLGPGKEFISTIA